PEHIPPGPGGDKPRPYGGITGGSVGAAISRPCPATGTTGAWNTSHPVPGGRLIVAPTALRALLHFSLFTFHASLPLPPQGLTMHRVFAILIMYNYGNGLNQTV